MSNTRAKINFKNCVMTYRRNAKVTLGKGGSSPRLR